MKIGIRTPSIKKRVKARTTAKVKRKVKGAINPLYGKDGTGYVNDHKKAIYNKIYNKTTVSAEDAITGKGMSIVLGLGKVIGFFIVIFVLIRMITY